MKEPEQKRRKKKKVRGKNFTKTEKEEFVNYVFKPNGENRYNDLEKMKEIKSIRIPGLSTLYSWKEEIENKNDEKPKKKKKNGIERKTKNID
eukprot:TRINITY_DN1575_c0_g1_i3.p1 TRINITY_DN1575_c0_g1~~TRINITY_DN1575_c0_g1_i3.p1  ORF type:complete len:92 (-),score=14.36 TRINITY_DN1575_c0_g1_i3:363-638(-)